MGNQQIIERLLETAPVAKSTRQLFCIVEISRNCSITWRPLRGRQCGAEPTASSDLSSLRFAARQQIAGTEWHPGLHCHLPVAASRAIGSAPHYGFEKKDREDVFYARTSETRQEISVCFCARRYRGRKAILAW